MIYFYLLFLFNELILNFWQFFFLFNREVNNNNNK